MAPRPGELLPGTTRSFSAHPSSFEWTAREKGGVAQLPYSTCYGNLKIWVKKKSQNTEVFAIQTYLGSHVRKSYEQFDDKSRKLKVDKYPNPQL